MLKFGVLACLVAVAFGVTNHYIGSLNSGSSVVNFPYPVNLCCRSSLVGQAAVKYVCAADKMSITETYYSDAACTTQTANMTYTTTSGDSHGSWACNGNNYYAAVDLYVTSTCASLFATTYYAVDVCYKATSGNYSSSTCTDTKATVDTYSASDTTCAADTIQTSLTVAPTCAAFTSTPAFTVYAKLTSCETGNATTTPTTPVTTDAAYIPSVMGIIILLVLNIVNLL